MIFRIWTAAAVFLPLSAQAVTAQQPPPPIPSGGGPPRGGSDARDPRQDGPRLEKRPKDLDSLAISGLIDYMERNPVQVLPEFEGSLLGYGNELLWEKKQLDAKAPK